MPLSEDFVWSLKMIVEAGGVDRLARALNEVGKSASAAQKDLVDLGDEARNVHVGNLLPEAAAIHSRTEAITRFKEQIAAAFAVVRQNQGDFEHILQFDTEKPLRGLLQFQRALDQIKANVDITPQIAPEFQTKLNAIVSAAKKAADLRIKNEAVTDPGKQYEIREQEVILGLLKAQDKEFKNHLATSQSNLRVLQQEQAAIAKFNISLEAGRGQRRIQQAQEATKLQGLVGPQQTPLKAELRAALVEEQRRLQADRRATLFAQVEGLPEESRARARRRIENELQIKEKNEIAAIDAKILKIETDQVEKAERLRLATSSRRDHLEVESARIAQRATAHLEIPDLGAAIRVADAQLKQRRGEIARRFVQERRNIEALPETDPNKAELLKKNNVEAILAIKNAELQKDQEISDATLAQNKALERQRQLVVNLTDALTTRKAVQEAQFQRIAQSSFTSKPGSALSAAKQAAQADFEREVARIEKTFREEREKIGKIPAGSPDRGRLEDLSEASRLNALKLAQYELEQKITAEEGKQNAQLEKQREEIHRLNESLVQRNLESRTRLNQFEVQSSRVTADAKLDPAFRRTLAGVASIQNAFSPRQIFRPFQPRQEVGNIADVTELKLQQRLDQGILQQRLAEARVQSERRRSLAEIAAVPEHALEPHVRELQIQTVEQTAVHSLRAIAAEFTPTNQKIKFFNEEISRLSAESAKFRQISFDLGILSQSFFAVGAAAVGVFAVGGQQISELSIRLGAFNAIAKQSPEELNKTQDAVVRLFAGVPVKNLDELGLALFNIQSSGFTAAESMQVLQTSAKLATLGMTDTDHAAKFLIQTLKSFNLNTDDSGRVASQLTQILNLSVGEFQQVGQAIAKASSSARLANQDLGALGASFAVLTTAGGLTPRRAGERISQLFRDLTQTRTRQAIGETLKFDIVGPEGVTRPIEEIIQAMVQARREGLLTQESFNKIFTNSASREAALILLNNFEKVKESAKAVRSPAEEFEETFKRATANVGSQFQILKNNLTVFSVAAASLLGPFVQTIGNVAKGFGEFALENKALVSGLTTTVATVGLSLAAGLKLVSLFLRLRGSLVDVTVGLLNFRKTGLEAFSAEELRNKSLTTANGLLSTQNAELLLNTELTLANARAKELAAGGAALGGVVQAGTVGATDLKIAGDAAKKAVGISTAAAETEGALSITSTRVFGALNLVTKGLIGLTIAGSVAVIIGGLVEALKKARDAAVEDQNKEVESYLKLSRATGLTTEETIKLSEAQLRLAEFTPAAARILENTNASPLAQVAAEQFEAQRTKFSGGFLGLGGFFNRLSQPNTVRQTLQSASQTTGELGQVIDSGNPIRSGNAGLRQIRELAKRFAEEVGAAQKEALVTGNRTALDDLQKVRALFIQKAKEADPKFEKDAEEAITQELDAVRNLIIKAVGNIFALRGESLPALETRARFEQEAAGTPFEQKNDLGQGLRGVVDFLGKLNNKELNVAPEFLTAGGQLDAKGHGALNVDKLRELVNKQILPSIKIDTPENLERARKAGAILYDRLTGSFAFPGKGNQLTPQGNFPGVILGRTVGLPISPFSQVIEGKQPIQAGELGEAVNAFILRQQQQQAEANVRAQVQTVVGSASDDFGRQVRDLEARFLEQQGRLRTQPQLDLREAKAQILAEQRASGDEDPAAQEKASKKLAAAEANFHAQQRANRIEAFNLTRAHELALLELASRRAQEQSKVTEQLHLQALEAKIQLEQAGAFSHADKIRILRLQEQLALQKSEFKLRDEILDLIRQQTRSGIAGFGLQDVARLTKVEEPRQLGQIEKTLLSPGVRTERAAPLPNTPTGYAPRTLPDNFAKQAPLPTTFEGLKPEQQGAFSRTFVPEYVQEISRLFLTATRTPNAPIPQNAAHLGLGQAPFAPTLAGLQAEILLRMPPDDRAILEPLLKQAKTKQSIPTPTRVRETSANLLGTTALDEPALTNLLGQQFAIQSRALELEGTRFGQNGCALAVSAILSGSVQGLEGLHEAGVQGLVTRLTGLGAKVVKPGQERPGDVAVIERHGKQPAHTGVVIERSGQLGLEHNSTAAGHRLAFDAGLLNRADFFVRLPANLAGKTGTPAGPSGVPGSRQINPLDQLAGLNTAGIDPTVLKKVQEQLAKPQPNLGDNFAIAFQKHADEQRGIRLQATRAIFDEMEALVRERQDLLRTRDDAILAAERAAPRTERQGFIFRETEALQQQTNELSQIAEQRRRVLADLGKQSALGARPGDIPSTVLAQNGRPGANVQPEDEEKARIQIESLAAQELKIRRETNQKIFESRRDGAKFEIDFSDKINENERQRANLVFFTSRLRGNGLAAERKQAEDLARIDTAKADQEITRLSTEFELRLRLGQPVDPQATSAEITKQQNEKLKIQQDLRQKISDIEAKSLAQELERQQLLLAINNQEQENGRLFAGLAGPISAELDVSLQRASVANQIGGLEAERVNLLKQAANPLLNLNKEERTTLTLKAAQIERQQQGLRLTQQQTELNQDAARRQKELDLFVRSGQIDQDRASLFQVQNPNLFRQAGEAEDDAVGRQLEAIDKLRSGWIDHFQFLADLYSVDREERLKNLRATLTFYKEDAEAAEQTRREINRLQLEDFQKLRSGLRDAIGGGIKDFIVRPESFSGAAFLTNIAQAIRGALAEQFLQKTLFPLIGSSLDKVAAGATRQDIPDFDKVRAQATDQGAFIRQKEQEATATLALSRSAQSLLEAAQSQQIAAQAQALAVAAERLGSLSPLGGEPSLNLAGAQVPTSPLPGLLPSAPLPRLTLPPGLGGDVSAQQEATERQQRQSLSGIRFALREEVGSPLKEQGLGGVARVLTPLALALPAFLAGDTKHPGERTKPDPFGVHDPKLTKLGQDLVLPASKELQKLIKPRVGDFTVGFGPGGLPEVNTTKQHAVLGGKQTLGQLATAFAAFQGGVEGGPLGGAVSGALTGAAFGPVGALIGGGLGLLGGLFHHKKKPQDQTPFPALPNVEDVLFASKFFIHGAGEGGRQGLPVNNSESTDNSVHVGDVNVVVHATSSDPDAIAKAAAAAVSREIGALR